LSELAVLGCSFKASISPAVGSKITASLSASPSTPPSTDNFVGNNGIYFDKVTVIVASGATVVLNFTPSGAISPSGKLLVPATIDINGTASDILDSSDKIALQKGDKGSNAITFLFPAPNGTTVPFSVVVTAEISDAGQTDVSVT
jgi:hypothetical protein